MGNMERKFLNAIRQPEPSGTVVQGNIARRIRLQWAIFSKKGLKDSLRFLKIIVQENIARKPVCTGVTSGLVLNTPYLLQRRLF